MSVINKKKTEVYHKILHWRSLPIIRHIRAMQFRRLRPFWNGESHGTSVIRYYWSNFLEKHKYDIHGHGLEIGTTETIKHFGGDRLFKADALDLSAHSPDVRIVVDLARADAVTGKIYDCFVNQFTTAVIYDIEAALYHAIRLLKPRGVLLINFWCLDYYLHRGLNMGTGKNLYMHWWFTPINVENLLHQLTLSHNDYQIEIYGNLLTRMAFLMNLPAHELTLKELEFKDPGQPLLICVRLVKPENWKVRKPEYKEPRWIPETSPAICDPKTGHYGDAYTNCHDSQ